MLPKGHPQPSVIDCFQKRWSEGKGTGAANADGKRILRQVVLLKDSLLHSCPLLPGTGLQWTEDSSAIPCCHLVYLIVLESISRQC